MKNLSKCNHQLKFIQPENLEDGIQIQYQEHKDKFASITIKLQKEPLFLTEFQRLHSRYLQLLLMLFQEL